jgi:hypothetical protein
MRWCSTILAAGLVSTCAITAHAQTNVIISPPKPATLQTTFHTGHLVCANGAFVAEISVTNTNSYRASGTLSIEGAGETTSFSLDPSETQKISIQTAASSARCNTSLAPRVARVTLHGSVRRLDLKPDTAMYTYNPPFFQTAGARVTKIFGGARCGHYANFNIFAASPRIAVVNLHTSFGSFSQVTSHKLSEQETRIEVVTTDFKLDCTKGALPFQYDIGAGMKSLRPHQMRYSYL